MDEYIISIISKKKTFNMKGSKTPRGLHSADHSLGNAGLYI